MRVIDLINTASEHLKNKGFDNSRLEVERMLGSVLGLSRIDLYMKFERPLTVKERDNFRSLYKRRLTHEPLQHLIGNTDFREIKVKTDRRALIPRSETELLVEIALVFLKKCDAPVVADIGTGTGVIALSVAFEIPESSVVAVDISDEALMLAGENARILGLEKQITFVPGNMFEGLKGHGPFDTIISNPPYVKTESIATLQSEIRSYDPHIALDGGSDGLRYISILAEGAPEYLKSGGALILECGEDQALKIKEILDNTRCYLKFEIIKDFAGKNRIVKAVKG